MTHPPVQICAIAGGSGAGKTTLAVKMLDLLGPLGTHLTIDWYYRDLSHLSHKERAAVNYDHPASLEVDLFARDLAVLADRRPVDAPMYSFATHTRDSQVQRVEPRSCIVTEGIHLLGLESVRAQCTLKVFIDVDSDVRLERRMGRDVAERGRTRESVGEQWMATVAPMHEEFVQPSMQHADVVVGFDDDLDEMAARLVGVLTTGV